MDCTRKTIAEIYSMLADEESKDIFGSRLLFSLTGDEKYMENVIKTTKEGKEFYRKIEETDTKKVIFGAGFWGRSIARQYSAYGFDCFVDNKALPYEEREGLPVISFEKYLKEYGDRATVFLGSRLYYNDLYEQLVTNGIAQEKIVNVGKLIDDMSSRQYFDLPCLPHTDNEVFVDAGGFDGKTSKLFIRWCSERYKKIYVLEPERKNVLQCEKNLLGEKAKFEIIPIGLWDRRCSLGFIENENGTSCISEKQSIDDSDFAVVSVDALDELISDNVTFIKMDIEGAEFRALKGAERIIKNFHPKLAVSIYHNAEDIWELPKLIMDICPDYRLYLRHYSIAQAETVLYAV